MLLLLLISSVLLLVACCFGCQSLAANLSANKSACATAKRFHFQRTTLPWLVLAAGALINQKRSQLVGLTRKSFSSMENPGECLVHREKMGQYHFLLLFSNIFIV